MLGESTFSTQFPGYWRLPKAEVDLFIRSALIVPDANVLLSLYRVTPKARDEIFKVFENFFDRLFVPHQVGLEYHRNRIAAAKDHLDFYIGMQRELSALRVQALQKMSEFSKRCALTQEEKEDLTKALDGAFEKSIGAIKSYESEFDLPISKILDGDPVLSRLSVILNGRVGNPFTPSRLAEAEAEGGRRRDAGIPPGFKDGKKGSNPFGDYILWEQVIQEASLRKIPVLIVSNDEKEDWVQKELNFSIGPRIELIKEMKERAGVTFHILTLARFLAFARPSIKEGLSDQTLNQAGMVPALPVGDGAAKLLVSRAALERVLEGLRTSLRYTCIEIEVAEMRLHETDSSLPPSLERDRILRGRFLKRRLKSQIHEIESAISAAQNRGSNLLIKLPASMKDLADRIMSQEHDEIRKSASK